MDIGMIVTFAGLFVAGLAGVLGVWMERDQEAPAKWAWVFSFLICVATGVEMSHSVVQAAEDGVTEEKMATVLEALAELAASGDNPALQGLVNTELAAASRSNPGVMKKMEKKAKAKGKDPKAIKRQANAGRRKAAGLPAKKPAAKGGKAGSKAGGKAGGKAPGKAGGKAGSKSGSKSGGKADGKGGKSDGKAGGKADGKGGKSDGKGGKSDGKSGGKSDKDKKDGGKSDKDKKDGGKSDGKSGKSDSKSDGKSGKKN